LTLAEIVPVTSEALEATVRNLLPSQRGFGEDLQASNVIMPIIDLTPSAEGSQTRQDLQTSLAFGSQTAFRVENTTTTIINNTGFYRVFGVVSQTGASAVFFNLSNGLSTKTILEYSNIAGDVERTVFDFVVFFASGESLSVQSSAGGALASGSTRQIADVNGTLVNPSGFTPQ
jgi:hypothetical protein